MHARSIQDHSLQRTLHQIESIYEAIHYVIVSLKKEAHKLKFNDETNINLQMRHSTHIRSYTRNFKLHNAWNVVNDSTSPLAMALLVRYLLAHLYY